MAQQKQLLIGQSDFRRLRQHNGYFVDKSLFIQEIIETGYLVMVIPRPRRFGKTLNLSMVRYFFEKNDTTQADLFTGLAIQKTPHFEQHQGRYPVITLTFKEQKSTSWEGLSRLLADLLRTEFERHRYLLEADALSDSQKRYYQSILDGSASMEGYSQSLRHLSSFLGEYHHQAVVILIDEYDTPIISGYLNNYYEEVITFMRNFLSGGLKDNPHLYKGVLTGILRVAKESIFSSLNNTGTFTVLNRRFATSFGFTEPELEGLLDYYDLRAHHAEIVQWYNGYLFGRQVIYNPWSVLNYLANREGPQLYWVNTGGTDLMHQLVTRGGVELRAELEQLLTGECIVRPIYESIVMRDLMRQDDLLWSFLLYSGYLTMVSHIVDDTYELRVPNKEVQRIYARLIQRWFAEMVQLPDLEIMLTALEQGDVRLFERMLRKVVTEVMSYHDLSGAAEKVYQALVLGMLVWLAPKYEIRTNREAGYGRYDMMFKPKSAPAISQREVWDGKRGIIIEFKRVEEDEEPQTVLDEALQQINEKGYTVELEAAGVTDILRLAVAFQGTRMWLKQGE